MGRTVHKEFELIMDPFASDPVRFGRMGECLHDYNAPKSMYDDMVFEPDPPRPEPQLTKDEYDATYFWRVGHEDEYPNGSEYGSPSR